MKTLGGGGKLRKNNVFAAGSLILKSVVQIGFLMSDFAEIL